jgi:hypothetical protein
LPVHFLFVMLSFVIIAFFSRSQVKILIFMVTWTSRCAGNGVHYHLLSSGHKPT